MDDRILIFKRMGEAKYLTRLGYVPLNLKVQEKTDTLMFIYRRTDELVRDMNKYYAEKGRRLIPLD